MDDCLLFHSLFGNLVKSLREAPGKPPSSSSNALPKRVCFYSQSTLCAVFRQPLPGSPRPQRQRRDDNTASGGVHAGELALFTDGACKGNAHAATRSCPAGSRSRYQQAKTSGLRRAAEHWSSLVRPPRSWRVPTSHSLRTCRAINTHLGYITGSS